MKSATWLYRFYEDRPGSWSYNR